MPHVGKAEHKQQSGSESARGQPHLVLSPLPGQRLLQGMAQLGRPSGGLTFTPWLRQSPVRLMRSPASGLTVNRPGDIYEQEADRMADQVMRMHAPVQVQRSCATCKDEEHKLQRKCAECEEEDKKQVHRRATGAGPSTAPAIVHQVLHSSGRPLDAGTRAFMEPRFGHSFGNVRVHTGPQATQSAAAVNARAYTVGHDLVFAAGEYAPHTEEGRRLLAHELAHTLQQGGTGAVLQRQETATPAYDIRLTYPPSQTEEHHALPLPDALRALRHFAGLVDAHLEGGFEGHQYLWQIHNDQYIVAGISDLLGGRSIPPLSIWDSPRTHLTRGRALVVQGDVPGAARELQQAAIETRAADRRIYEYREGTIAGAERAVFGLQVVQVASAAVITVGTGGTAGVLLGAGYTGAQRLAGEAAAVHYGLQDHIDWGGVAFDTLFALVAGRFGGTLGNAIAGRIGSAMVARLGEAAAARVASQVTARVVSSLIVGRASGIAHAVARELFDALRGTTELTVDGFINRLAEQLTLRAAFLDLVVAAAGSATEAARGPTTPAPETPPPTQRLSGPTRSIQGGAPGRVRVEGGRVVSSSRSSTRSSTGGARASVGRGGLALAAVPEPVTEPIVEPAVRPVPPVPEAPRAAGTGSSPSSSTVPGAVAVAAVAGSASSSTGTAPQVRLVLPPQKAAHADLYRSLIRARQLEHTPGVPRQTAQATNWDRELRPGGPMEIYSEIWQRFEQMDISEVRRLRPDWSRTLPRVDMQVDHRVEWQLLGTANRTWGDTIANYELLDQPSNGSAGSTLRSNIQAERQRLTTSTGNPSYLTQPIVFTHLVVPSTVSSAMRWLPEEIQQGDHYYALLGHQRDRIRRGR